MADDAETENSPDRDESDGSDESPGQPRDDEAASRPDETASLDGEAAPPEADDAEAADGSDPADEDGEADWSDESFEPSDLVAGGQYAGNDGDERDDEDGDGADGPPDGTADAPPESAFDDVPEGAFDDLPEGTIDDPSEWEVDGSQEDDDEQVVFTRDLDDGNLSRGERPEPAERERPDNMAEATPIERKTGPPEDQEMPLADHVEEMVSRLFIVVAIAGVVSVALFPLGEELIDLLWYQVLPGGDVARPRLYHPLSLVMTQLKVASLGGLIVALPVFVYQTYAFMKPGLYPHERRYYLAAVPTSLVLAFVGITFAFYVILPAIFTYFLYYSDTVVTIAFALSDTFNLILLLMGYLAVVFQIPLFIMLAIMMGLTTRRWLENRRLYFWAAFLGISFVFNPDPTGMAPFLVTITMITLFEGTLLLLRWTGR